MRCASFDISLEREASVIVYFLAPDVAAVVSRGPLYGPSEREREGGAQSKRMPGRSVESAAGVAGSRPRNGVEEQYQPKSHGGNFGLGSGVEAFCGSVSGKCGLLCSRPSTDKLLAL